jgi:translocation and assembly module TamB
MGEDESVSLIGQISSIGGRFKFKDHIYNVERAILDFQDPNVINPQLDVLLTTMISEYTPGVDYDIQDVHPFGEPSEREHKITVRITGKADSPIVEVSSDDASLSSEDIITLLTLGIRTGMDGTEGEAKAIASGVNILSKITGMEKKIERLIPIPKTHFQVVPAYSEEAGTIVPRIQIRWKLTDKLKLEYSSTLDQIKNEQATIEYKINDVTSITGRWDNESRLGNVDDIGIDMKWRWEF